MRARLAPTICALVLLTFSGTLMFSMGNVTPAPAETTERAAGWDCRMYHHSGHHYTSYGETWHHFHYNDGSGRAQWARYSGTWRSIGTSCWHWTR